MVAASQWVMFPVAHWNTGGFLTYKVLQEEGSRTFNARDFSCFLSTTVHAGLRGYKVHINNEMVNGENTCCFRDGSSLRGGQRNPGGGIASSGNAR